MSFNTYQNKLRNNPQKSEVNKLGQIDTTNIMFNILSESVGLGEKLLEIKEGISTNRSNIETYNNNLEDQETFLEELIDAVKQSLTPAACVAGPYPVTLTNPAFLEKVKAKLNTMLSDRVTTI